MNLPRETLRSDIAATLPDNTVGGIDPAAVLRALLYSVVDSQPNHRDEPLAALLHTHAIGDIVGLVAALAPWEVRSGRNAANGFAGLDAAGRLALAQLTLHAASHRWGGSDPISPASLYAASLSHAGRHALGEYDALTAGAIGAAALSHSGRHALGGADPLTAGAIGAASLSHAHRHAPGGDDPLTPADLGAAAVTHSHSGSESWVAAWVDGVRKRTLRVALEMPEPRVGEYDLHLSARHAAAISYLRHATLSGSVQATVLVDGAAVAGLSGLTATSTVSVASPSGGASFAQGARIRLRIQGVAGMPGDYAFEIGMV